MREETRGITEKAAAGGAAAAEKELKEVEEDKENEKGVRAAAGAGRGGAVPDVATRPPHSSTPHLPGLRSTEDGSQLLLQMPRALCRAAHR